MASTSSSDVALRAAAARKAEIVSLFKIFDRDGDGSLTIDEIKAVYTRGPGGLNEAELEKTVQMLMKYDKYRSNGYGPRVGKCSDE